MTPTLDAALLISSRAGADLGRTSDRLESNASLRREGEVGADENRPLLYLQATTAGFQTFNYSDTFLSGFQMV